MKILKQNELDQAAELLKEGKVIAFPTETVYGLGVLYDDKEAYDRLCAVKRRPPEKPFTLMLADVGEVEKYADLNNVGKALVKNFMPGQFTLIAKAQKGLPEWCVSSIGNVGIRIADYELIRNLIKKAGKPLLVPSANKSGEKPATTAYDVVEAFGEELAAVVEGESISNIPSTIVCVTDTYTEVFREGAVKIEDIKKVVKEASK
jgi:L-threonylcarbamoyladenylate synthase